MPPHDHDPVAGSPLGKSSAYPEAYDPALLVSIPRDAGRAGLGLGGELPFEGVDVWNAFELSWLDARGKPVVAGAELRVPASSPAIVESKSLKLYLNSLNAMKLDGPEAVAELVRKDLEPIVGSAVGVTLFGPGDPQARALGEPPGECLDELEVDVDTYDVEPELLACAPGAEAEVDECLHSHLLKSNCPVTGQPDWATVVIRYCGRPIDRAALLRYLISFRDHDEFHEHCVERMFLDIERRCAPQALSVGARYTRRGGIDINPFRSDFEDPPPNVRFWRQ